MAASFGVERQNPLPVGRYWVFRNTPKDIVEFDAWLGRWRKAGALKVRASELGAGPNNSPVAFVIFEVTQGGTVVWDQPGLPDRAAPHVASSEDVLSSPRPKDPVDQLADSARAVTRAGEQLPVLLFALGLLYLLTQTKGNRNVVYD